MHHLINGKMKNLKKNNSENNNPTKLNIMKKIMLFTCGIICSLTLLAQPPQGINYQAVVRNSSGEIVSNQTVNFRFHIRLGSETGTILYTETQDILTDQYGLAGLVIGSVTPVTGTFEGIDWTGGNIWIEVEMDPANTYTYVSMGTEQFQSVPYALYSGSDWNASGDNLYYNEGNVGIGTDAPNEKLEVVGNVFINNNDLGVEQSLFLGPSSPTVSIGREAGSKTMLLKSGVDGMASGTGFKFLIADEDKMILDENGKLHVAGKVKIEVMDIGHMTDSLVSWNPADSTLRLIPIDSIRNTSGGIAGAIVDADGDTKIQVEASPDEDVIHFDMAGTEFFRMDNGRLEVFNTGSSVFMGAGAGANDDLVNNQNVAIGYQSLYSNTEGYWNTATGYRSLFSNTIGIFNTSNGYSSLVSNTEGKWNTATGFYSLQDNTTGWHNTATGAHSLENNTTASYNTANGFKALYSNTTGGYNTAIGTWALGNNTTGYFNTAVGYYANVGSGNLTNATAIGAKAIVSQSNSLVLGAIAGVNGASTSTNVGIGTTAPDFPLHIYSNYHPWDAAHDYHIKLQVTNGWWTMGLDDQAGDADFVFRSSEDSDGYTCYIDPANGGWQITSDRRLKKNIQPLTGIIEKIQMLEPVSYLRLKQDDNAKLEIGFIAQDVYEIFPEYKTAKEKGDIWTLGYADFGTIAIAGIKELKAEKDNEIDELKARIEELESRLAQFEKMMAEYGNR